jgi:hypothetical protein
MLGEGQDSMFQDTGKGTGICSNQGEAEKVWTRRYEMKDAITKGCGKGPGEVSEKIKVEF